METLTRFFKEPKQSFFLLGPRGTGKSFWTKQSEPKALNIDLLKPDIFRHYSARPERLIEVIEAHPKNKAVVIDEVQKVPEILSVVHSLIEDKRGLKFILTGSSARKLKRTGADLMAGRAVMKTLHPFMASEIGRTFSLEKALRLGMLPLVLLSEEPEETLKSYLGLYLREEVQMEALVRDIGSFSRFLEVVSFSHGAVINLNNISAECSVNRKTVEGYVEVLEDLLLSYKIPVFTKKAKRELAAHPKFYFFDAGVFRSIRPKGPLDQPSEIDGAAIEGLVIQHLRAWNDYRGKNNQLYYWRTRSNLEVDLILYGDDGIWALEIKNNPRVRPQDLKGLQSFQEDYPHSHTALIYRGKERLKIGNVLCIPCDEFLKNLHPNTLPWKIE